jgi:hypothetical protein
MGYGTRNVRPHCGQHNAPDANHGCSRRLSLSIPPTRFILDYEVDTFCVPSSAERPSAKSNEIHGPAMWLLKDSFVSKLKHSFRSRARHFSQVAEWTQSQRRFPNLGVTVNPPNGQVAGRRSSKSPPPFALAERLSAKTKSNQLRLLALKDVFRALRFKSGLIPRSLSGRLSNGRRRRFLN